MKKIIFYMKRCIENQNWVFCLPNEGGVFEERITKRTFLGLVSLIYFNKEAFFHKDVNPNQIRSQLRLWVLLWIDFDTDGQFFLRKYKHLSNFENLVLRTNSDHSCDKGEIYFMTKLPSNLDLDIKYSNRFFWLLITASVYLGKTCLAPQADRD